MVVRGPFLVRWVNLATSEGIYLWDIRRPNKDLLVTKIGIQGFYTSRSLLRKTKCHVRIRQRCGLPFLWQKLRRRRMWLLGMLMTTLGLMVLSSMVLFIRIEGVGDPQGKLRRELQRYGVTLGANRGKIEKKLETIEEELKIGHSEYLWVDAELHGVLLKLKIVKRITPPTKNKPADLIAEKAGRIQRMTVVRGTPIVQEGDTVAAGDLLIAGYQVFKELDGGMSWMELPAKGRIEAVIGYDVVIMEPMSTWVSRPGTSRRIAVWLRWRNQLIPLMGWGRISGASYREVHRKRLGKGRNPSSLVELVIDNTREVRWEKHHVTFAEAMVLAKKRAGHRLKVLIPSGARVTRSWDDWIIEGSMLHYRQVIEVVEDIGIPRPREKE